MTERYRLVIIGGGSGGLAAAGLAAHLGVSVALIERGRIGGDCTWTGCVPSKALLAAAAVAQTARTAARFGINVVEPQVDFGAVMDWVRRSIDGVYQHETPAVLTQQGICVREGEARFLDPRTIAVGNRKIVGERILIATGARPIRPPIPGLTETPHFTYETIFDLITHPRHLIVLGAGTIGCELAQAFRRLGSEVTLIDEADRVASVADPEASALLGERLSREGVVLHLASRVERVVAERGAIRVDLAGGPILGDALLVATGRRPDLADLELDRAGVAWSEDGVAVDDRLRTSQPHIYACGDAIGSFQFTHYAGWQGVLAARNALLPGATRANRETVPWAIFTDPEIAQVGPDERQARERFGRQVRIARWPAGRIDRAVTDGETAGFFKLVYRSNGALLGATLACARAGELAHELSLALERRLTIDQLARTMHVYPTYGFGLQQAAADALFHQLTAGPQGALLRLLARWWPRT